MVVPEVGYQEEREKNHDYWFLETSFRDKETIKGQFGA